ncbi:hypothetical protein AXG93_209s1000 [Marchantia polymorpha subsp. ruderalis]|uniref:Uncharacterized protein n=1 Tax=Marchantia polymorpha subsp. ruderalis TaxID=1480154 RepID=A0A176VIU4_MARPO|nr:hypothetical protein AXG93_209s1000 [Marchantia polymorpha subsp. ruderalis]
MDVKVETINNCFRHCRIRSADADIAQVAEGDLVDLDVLWDLEHKLFCMHQDDIDVKTLAAIQKIKDKVSVIRTNKLVQKPILEYFSKS